MLALVSPFGPQTKGIRKPHDSAQLCPCSRNAAHRLFVTCSARGLVVHTLCKTSSTVSISKTTDGKGTSGRNGPTAMTGLICSHCGCPWVGGRHAVHAQLRLHHFVITWDMAEAFSCTSKHSCFSSFLLHSPLWPRCTSSSLQAGGQLRHTALLFNLCAGKSCKSRT